MTSASLTPRMHIPELDGVRAFSILFVIIAHTVPLSTHGTRHILEPNAMFGRMGMSLFFFLSGYLIVSGLNRGQLVRDFFVRRISRIVPSAVMVLTVLFFIGLPFDAYVYNVLFISNYIDEDLNGFEIRHFWSLGVEMQFYLAIGLVVLAFGRRGVWIVFPLILLFTGLRVYSEAFYNIRTHLRIDEILVGGCTALLLADSRRFAWTMRWVKARGTIFLILVLGLWIASCNHRSQDLNYLRPYITALLVVTIVYGEYPNLRRLLCHRFMSYIAKISYALYIYHFLMISGFMNEGSAVERYLVKRPISYALTLLFAHISTFWWERFWSDWAKRAFIQQRPRDELAARPPA